jgi:AcrR family transcriptional regulator
LVSSHFDINGLLVLSYQMKEVTKIEKEQNIIDAAEQVFAKVGFKNANMQKIADLAKITKVTLYSYYKSKENLYMAITHKALSLLVDQFYKTIELSKDKPGLESTIAILEKFMTFCEENYLYSEVLLDYFSMNRSSAQGTNTDKLTDAMMDSIYLAKVQDMQNLPFKLITQEIQRGRKDGSIHSESDPMLHTLHGWTSSIGYIKVVASSGNNASPLFNVRLTDLKKLNLQTARILLSSNYTVDL